jgi:hypothetical protein
MYSMQFTASTMMFQDIYTLECMYVYTPQIKSIVEPDTN